VLLDGQHHVAGFAHRRGGILDDHLRPGEQCRTEFTAITFV
jgi:hypothetical protein